MDGKERARIEKESEESKREEKEEKNERSVRREGAVSTRSPTVTRNK